jgi:hypothetical protein
MSLTVVLHYAILALVAIPLPDLIETEPGVVSMAPILRGIRNILAMPSESPGTPTASTAAAPSSRAWLRVIGEASLRHRTTTLTSPDVTIAPVLSVPVIAECSWPVRDPRPSRGGAYD